MYIKLRKIKHYVELLQTTRYCNVRRVEEMSVCSCGYKKGHTPPPLESFTPYSFGEPWGEMLPDRHAWFHFWLDVTAEMCQKPLQLQFERYSGDNVNNPQFLIYLNGTLKQGMDANHTYVYIDGPGKYEVYLYAYTGRMNQSTHTSASLTSPLADIGLRAVTRNVEPDVEQLYYDLKIPLDTLEFLDPNGREYAQTIAHLDRAVSYLDMFEIGSDAFFASVRDAAAYMRDEFYGKYCCKQPTTTLCVGHTHIDCAWLWTLKQSREKVQRSFSTVVELMRRYPEYKFTSSQPLLYKYLKEEAPEIYEEIKRLVKEGRWECEGAMWVEADCNLPSGESLVRQVVYGKRFFREEFGVESRVLWLPDVFGYSAALPQILRKSGVDWFVTSKISWNDTNSMPYHTFSWKGIDGTEIPAYFLTSRNIDDTRGHVNYNGKTTPKMLTGTYAQYSQKALTDEVMLTYGHGDGGGGPTVEHLEMIRREEKGIPGMPNAKTGFVGDFLRRMEQRMADQVIPKWSGELYLEFHRGTYTSIAKNKRNNRRAEFLYQNAELMGCLGKQLLGKPFPKAALREGWEMILTNQFHDIIPGSSIKEVYDQCDKDYARIMEIGEDAVNTVQREIADSFDQKHGYVVFNPHSFTGDAAVRIDGKTTLVSGIPQKGYACASVFVAENKIQIKDRCVETALFTVRFDEFWQIESIYDKKNQREVLRAGEKGNEIRLYPDYPDKYDAWEWQEYSLDCYKALTAVSDVAVMEDGARRGIRITRPYLNSTLTQTVWFYDRFNRIEFETVADWHEKHIMVKAAFPVNVNSDKATYEIQFGAVERPTHKNTGWDRAKFEVCAHKYADLSDNGYGVALINDCKYGHDIHDGVMQLSLFKCADHPNVEADEGEHIFTYAICPHAGTLMQSDVAKQAYLLNNPLTAIPTTGARDLLPTSYSAVTLDCDHAFCETVKEAEEGSETVIRLYEAQNKCGKATLTFGFDVDRVSVCDLLEQNESELPVNGRSVTVDLHGFEIVTLKVTTK